MPTPAQLLARLDAIGQALEASGHARALIGLGSVGLERQRLDAYSDLDFFVIVEEGFKAAYIDDLGWLAAAHPIAYHFQNTVDGHKALMADGVFCEFAVFEEAELAHIPFAPGRIVWRRPDVPEAIAAPPPAAPPPARPLEWVVGEALTNLYVGLGRYARGEGLSAMRFIEVYALDRVVELCERLGAAGAEGRDLFSAERRLEARLPELAAALPELAQGYGRSRQSARAILAFIEGLTPVSPAMRQAILALCADGPDPRS